MLFLIIGTDHPNAAAERQRLRPSHVDYWLKKSDQVKLGGPLLTTATPEASARASVLLIEAGDEKEARSIAAADPFALEGVFETQTVSPMRLTLGTWLPATA